MDSLAESLATMIRQSLTDGSIAALRKAGQVQMAPPGTLL